MVIVNGRTLTVGSQSPLRSSVLTTIAEMATPEHYRNGVPVVKILTGTPFRTVPAQFHQDVPYNPSLHHPSHSTILKL